MSERNDEFMRGLGGRFVVGVVLLVAALAGLVAYGDRLLSGATDPLYAVVLVLVVYLLVLLSRLPYTLPWPGAGSRPAQGSVPTLQRELEDSIADYRVDVRGYQTELASLGDDPHTTAARRELDGINDNLKIALSRLDHGKYVSAFRRYYLAQRDLVDVVTALMRADEAAQLNRNRLAELVDQCWQQAEALSDAKARAAVQSRLRAYDDTTLTADTDLSPLKSALRRLHDAQLRSLSGYLRLRGLLGWVNVALTVFVLLVTVGVVVLTAADVVTLVTTATLPTDESTRALLLVVPVFVLGGFGAVLNIFRRFGRNVVFGTATVLPELPDDLVVEEVLRSRVLWGAVAALVVYVFTLLGGGLDPASVFLTATAAGFSEQLLDKVLEKQQERIATTVETENSPGPGAPDTRSPTGPIEATE